MHVTRSVARPARIADRTGAVHASLAWRDDGALASLDVDGARVCGDVIEHPLLGRAHAIELADGATAMSAIDWAHPTEIPAIAEPGKLPMGCGAAILNALAVVAQDAGVRALRYAGPYPTPALWRSVLRSFRTDGNEATFIVDAMDRAIRVAREPIAIDFAPAPHQRVAVASGFVEVRDGVERVVLDGVGYELDGSPARLIVDGDRVHAELWFGDARYARIASLCGVGDEAGAIVDGPHAVPVCVSSVIGRAFPPPLVGALAMLVAEAVPAPLAADARQLCATLPLRWADLGPRAAREDAQGLAVHAALWDHIAPLGLGRLALALAEALAPVVARAVVRRLTPP